MPHDELIERAATAIQRWHHENGKLRPSWQEAQGQARAVVEAALTTIQDREATLIRVLTECRDKFREYELLHLAKFTEDGDEKADRNRELVAVCDEALGTSGLVERS